METGIGNVCVHPYIYRDALSTNPLHLNRVHSHTRVLGALRKVLGHKVELDYPREEAGVGLSEIVGD